MKIFILSFLLIFVSCKKTTDGAAPASDPESAKIAAATTTAISNSFCQVAQPFYWEIGTGTGKIAGASVGTSPPDATTVLSIASASKMIFASYVLEKKSGVLTTSEIKGLNFTSSYSTFTSCVGQATVNLCYSNIVLPAVPANDNKFYYGGGHMQKIAAVDLSIGAIGAAGLATEVATYVGIDLGLSYTIPQPAGGVQLSANGYALFLRKILNQNLRMNSFLGTNAVCTNTTNCPSTALSTPIPSTEAWQYSLGHWIENDPTTGDGTFSSPGLYGFYPWITSDKSRYGILARYNTGINAYWESVQCGRLIRKAYLTGVAQ
jgi:hypothetical protein